MKKNILFLLLIVATFPTSTLFAEEQTQEAPTRQNILQERIEKQRTNYVQNLQEARDIAKQYRESNNEEEKDSLRAQARNGFTIRLNSAITQLTTMQTRVGARIETSQEQGFDTTQASELLVKSQTELEFVLNEKEKIETLLQSTEEIDEETKNEAKLIFETIKEHFKNSRTYLMESVSMLKDITIKKNQEAAQPEMSNETKGKESTKSNESTN